MLTGQNGILNRAAEAKEKNELASIDEQRKLAQSEALMNTETSTYKGVYLPEGFAPTKIKGEDSINDGLVITDGDGNEYVWVEVPKTEEVYPTAGINVINFTNEEYTKIENDLHTYTKDYRNGTTCSDTFYDASNDTKEVYKSGWYQSQKEYDTIKKKMLKSLYQNKGFWIGRYEAGINTNRTEKGDTTTTPITKANAFPYNYVTRTQAKVLSEKVESGSYTSSLMFGVQWDLVLKYIETKNATTQNNLGSNSTSIGNYYNNLWNIANITAKYSLDSGYSFSSCPYKKETDKDILLTTGADKSFSLMNIFDIAGNVWEWTLEKSSDESCPCIYRGGYFGTKGSSSSASYRNNGFTSGSFFSLGFRVSIF